MNLLIELINSFISSLNTREMALIILAVAFLILISFKKSVRKAELEIMRIFFSIKIMIPFILMVCYVLLILFVLYYSRFLNIYFFKDVVFWFVVVAIPLFFATNKYKDDKNFFKNKVIDYIKFATIFGFFIDFYTFNIFVELILQAVLFFIICLILVSKSEEKYKPAENFFSLIFLIIIAYLVIFFITNFFINPNSFININTGITYILPAILTILLLPFIYIWALYMRYDFFYALLKLRLNDSRVSKQVFIEVFSKYKLNLYKLDIFLSRFRFWNIKTIEDAEKEILLTEERVKLEKQD